MLKWMLIVLLVIVLLVVATLVAGMFIPKQHVARSSVTLHQAPDSVWNVVRALGNYHDWWPNVKSVERLQDDGGREIWVQRDKRNQPMPLEVVQSAPPSRLVTRIADDRLPFGGTWTYEIEAIAEGSVVTITEDGEIYNPIFRVVARLFVGYHGTMDSYLKALGARFGEAVNPAH